MTTGVNSTTAAGAASGSSNSALNQLSGNFDTFLQLLTTQLQNQDPLDPMDTSQFTQQLVEYSQVEQQIDTNTNLQSLISQGTQQSAAYATGYLGKTVTVSGGEGSLTNGQAQWNYNLGTASSSTTLQITDANGNVVFNGSGQTTAGNNTFNWNGQDNNGNQLPDGSYTLAVKAAAGSQTVTTTVTEITSGGIEVKFGDDDAPMSAFIRKSDLSRDRSEQRPERFAVGDRLDAQVTNVDKAARRVSLSVKALEMAEDKEAIEKFGSSDSGASLGDILGAALREKASKE